MATGLALAACAGTACGPFGGRGAGSPGSLDTLAVATEIGDSLMVAGDMDYSGLEILFPEIVQLEVVYREALQALWSEDLALAEERVGAIDSALAEVAEDENPLAAIYYQSLGARLDRLKDLMMEERTLVRYLAKVDSLSVISPDGFVDSLALSSLLERPAHRPTGGGPRHDLELVENPLTERWVRFFTGDGRHYMDLWLSRLPRYENTIYTTLDEYDLPRDLIYLAMIESGLSMKAHSVANAVGPWQFIASTGRLYDLKIDWWLDERRHLEKSTRAAASHLSDLYQAFGSWPLALAAYNCGAQRVNRAIRRHGSRDFWRLSSLPSQTRNYVPKFMAALYIGKASERYGFRPAAQPAYAFDLVTVEDATDLRLLAELSGATLEEILELNPHQRRWCTPPGERYEVKVPAGKGAACTERLAQIPQEERITWRRHRIRKGETLSELARSYATSVQAICQANKLKTSSRLHPGHYLLIPIVAGDEPGTRVAAYIAEAAKSADRDAASTGRAIVYKVRRGDTLSSIGRKHNVSVRQIMAWNKKRSTRIYIGERLRIQARGTAD